MIEAADQVQGDLLVGGGAEGAEELDKIAGLGGGAAIAKDAKHVLVVRAQPELAVVVGAAIDAGTAQRNLEVAADGAKHIGGGHPILDFCGCATEELAISRAQAAGDLGGGGGGDGHGRGL